MRELGIVQKKGFWSTFHTFLGCIYTGAKILLVLGIAAAVFGIVLKGTSGNYAPLGWKQVHEQTQFQSVRALNAQPTQQGDEAVAPAPSVAVLKYDGDVEANGRDGIARAVDEILVNREHVSEVVLVVNSGGGAVTGYGQIFAELKRLRDAGISLTVCVDQVAASGGYMMSLPANKILAAPLAIVGSVGVVVEMPNFSQLLKTLGVNYITITSGKYKRTLTPTNDVTPEATAKVTEEVNEQATAFWAMVQKYRTNANMDIIKTADHWTAEQSVALNLGLVDGIETSAQYLLDLRQSHGLIYLSEAKPITSPLAGLIPGMQMLADHAVDHLLDRMTAQQQPMH